MTGEFWATYKIAKKLIVQILPTSQSGGSLEQQARKITFRDSCVFEACIYPRSVHSKNDIVFAQFGLFEIMGIFMWPTLCICPSNVALSDVVTSQ